jgi:hypothetical protein
MDFLTCRRLRSGFCVVSWSSALPTSLRRFNTHEIRARCGSCSRCGWRSCSHPPGYSLLVHGFAVAGKLVDREDEFGFLLFPVAPQHFDQDRHVRIGGTGVLGGDFDVHKKVLAAILRHQPFHHALGIREIVLPPSPSAIGLRLRQTQLSRHRGNTFLLLAGRLPVAFQGAPLAVRSTTRKAVVVARACHQTFAGRNRIRRYAQRRLPLTCYRGKAVADVRYNLQACNPCLELSQP